MNRSTRARAALTGCLLLTSLAAQRSDPTGTWNGTLETGAIDLRLVVHIAGEVGALTATADSPDQGAEGMTVDEISYSDGQLKFAMRRLGASYEGAANEDGSEIAGTFSQGGKKLPLTLRRGTVEKPKRPQMPQPPFPYRIEEVSFAHGDAITLAGTLTLPPGKGPYPAAVLVSGSGPQDRDETLLGHKPFWVLADHLSRHGIAVLRYDDRGTAKSTGDFKSATTADFAEDALAAIRYLRTREDIRDTAVGIIGHSEGGLIGPIAAADAPDEVAFVVMLAGPGVTGRAILDRQTRLMAAAQGGDNDEIERGLANQSAMLDAVREHQDPVALKKALRTLAEAAWSQLGDAERAEVGGDRDALLERQIAELTRPWMRFFLDHDPAPVLERVRCPVLALTGERDLQVDPVQNLPPIAAALLRGACTDHAVVQLPALNHLFQHSTTGSPDEYRSIEETFAPIALRTISDWIAARFGE